MKTPILSLPVALGLLLLAGGLSTAAAQTPDAAPAVPAAPSPVAPEGAEAPATPLTPTAPATDVDPTTPPPVAPPAPASPPLPLEEGSAVDEIGRRVRRLADELRSPFCPGKTLMTCTSYQAFELRREMREMIEQGMSDGDIIDALVLRHGEEVRNPPQPWYTILVPILPFLVLGVLLFWIFRKWKERDRKTPDAATPELDPADAERLARLRARTRAEFE